MTSGETYFPRGSVKNTGSKQSKPSRRKDQSKQLQLFKKHRVAVKNANPHREQRNEKKQLEKLALKISHVKPLLYDTLQEGFVVAGCVREVYSTAMIVTLPGRLTAQVKINKISTPYNNLLSSYADEDILPEHVPTLHMLFKVGEMVTCCVETATRVNSCKHSVHLSLNPVDVNQDKCESILEENVVLVGAVKSLEDHGYTIDLGIEGVTAFLPFKRTKAYLKEQNCESLIVGKVIKVVVKKVLRAKAGTTTVELSIEGSDTQSSTFPTNGFTINNLTPGQSVDVYIKQVITEGIEVSLVQAKEEMMGYVHISHIPDTWGNVSELMPGKVFKTTLLYTLTPVNILYFSMKSYYNNKSSSPRLKNGAIIEKAKVFANSGRGVYLQLVSKNINAKGFVPQKQCTSATDYALGQSCRARVMHYDHIEKLYVCSLNKDVLSAEVISLKDLHLGQIVKCSVIELKENGLVLKLGSFTVFAPVAHLADHSHRIPDVVNRYELNSEVTAKVLRISDTNSNVIVTLKPTLISSESLCSYEEAVQHKGYYGSVNKITNAGMVIRFFGDLFGFVSNNMIASYATGYSKESFHVGQLIRCYVVNTPALAGSITLRLIPDAASDLKLGSNYNLEIVASTPYGFEVIITNTNLSGFLPLCQITDHVNLLESVRESLTIGKLVKDAVLYRLTEDLTPQFSLRTSVKQFILTNPLIYSKSYPGFNSSNSDVNVNYLTSLIVPCSVSKIESSGIHLSVALPGRFDSCFISNESFEEDIKEHLKENQCVMSLALLNHDGTFELKISSFKFTGEFRAGVEILEDYLNSAAEFQTVSIGQKVEVKVVNVSDDEIKVKLIDTKLAGSFKTNLADRVYEKNDKFHAIVLWQNPINQHVHFFPDVSRFSENQDDADSITLTGSIEHAQVLLIQDEFFLCLLENQLTVIPSRAHFNDFICKKPSLLGRIKIVPCSFHNNIIISEREKRVKLFAEKMGIADSKIISELLGRDIFVSANSRKKKRKRSQSHSETESKIKENYINNDTVIINSQQFVNQPYEKLCKKRNSFEVTNNNSSKDESINSYSSCNESEQIQKESGKKKKKSLDSINNEEKLSSRKRKISTSKNLQEVNSSSHVNGDCDMKPEESKEKVCSNENVECDVTCSRKRKNSVTENSREVDSPCKVKKSKKLKDKNRESVSKDNFKVLKQKHDGDIDDDNEFHEKTKECEKGRLSLPGSGNFSWNVDANNFTELNHDDTETNVEEEDDDVDDEKEQKQNRKPKTAAEKKIAAKEAEQRLREAEKRLLEAETNPQSVDHFERLTLAQPTNSLIWIKYMAHHLQATEIEKARAIANRALIKIGHREEQERLNVWVALMNLENLYGTEESLKKTVDEAVRNNDEYHIYSKLAEIYTDSGKNVELDQVVDVMVRKFKTNMECLLVSCRCLLKSGMTEKARSVFQRGLNNFPKKDHVQCITRFALLENAHGSSEHAQTLMEHVLTTYPGRLPAWTTYIDMLIKSGRVDLARNVLERSVGQKLPVKKMKTLYKKWMQFEQQHGNESTVNHVREAAENYINSLSSTIDAM